MEIANAIPMNYLNVSILGTYEF